MDANPRQRQKGRSTVTTNSSLLFLPSPDSRKSANLRGACSSKSDLHETMEFVLVVPLFAEGSLCRCNDQRFLWHRPTIPHASSSPAYVVTNSGLMLSAHCNTTLLSILISPLWLSL